MKSVIEVKDVAYTYAGGIDALSGISFDVNERERLGILGPNGAGKSTLILLMAGLLKPKYGKITVFGKETTTKEFEGLRRKIGLVFQDPEDQLFNNTVFDDIAYGPRSLGLSEDEVERRVYETLSIMGITHLAERPPHRLSFGEKKKAAIATALVLKPEVLLLDEPTANLDQKSKKDLLLLLQDLNREGTTIVLATHDVEILSDFVERAILMNAGKILETGLVGAILNNERVLQEASIEPPLLISLFMKLKAKGLLEKIPSNIDEAVGIIEEALASSAHQESLSLRSK